MVIFFTRSERDFFSPCKNEFYKIVFPNFSENLDTFFSTILKFSFNTSILDFGVNKYAKIRHFAKKCLSPKIRETPWNNLIFWSKRFLYDFLTTKYRVFFFLNHLVAFKKKFQEKVSKIKKVK